MDLADCQGIPSRNPEAIIMEYVENVHLSQKLQNSWQHLGDW